MASIGGKRVRNGGLIGQMSEDELLNSILVKNIQEKMARKNLLTSE